MLSVVSIPIFANGLFTAPIENGITYIVRPIMLSFAMALSFLYISSGSIQLLVGPASSFLLLQMKVLPSTRATSLGFVR